MFCGTTKCKCVHVFFIVFSIICYSIDGSQYNVHVRLSLFTINTITACMVVQAVVNAIHNYVAGVTTHANPCGAATTWVVLANA